MKHRLVGYHEWGRVFFIAFQVRVSYSFFFLYSLAAMLSYDTRLLLGIGVGRLAFILYSSYSISGYFICTCICSCFCTVKCCHGLSLCPPVWCRDLRGKDGTDEGVGFL